MASALALALAAGAAVFTWQSAADSDSAIAAAGYDAKDKAAIEAIVRAYILENPEIIPEAVEVLKQRQSAAKIGDLRDQLETPFAGAWMGNPDGDVVLVEFSDYACGYCRKSVADVERLVKEDPKLKVVFRELPILSEESNDAAAMAMAAARQGKYLAFHNALFAAGRPNESTIAAAARTAGLDMAAANAFINGAEPQTQIDANLTAARQLEFTGTPSWIVGGQILVGAVGYDALKAAVAAARTDGGAAGMGSR